MSSAGRPPRFTETQLEAIQTARDEYLYGMYETITRPPGDTVAVVTRMKDLNLSDLEHIAFGKYVSDMYGRMLLVGAMEDSCFEESRLVISGNVEGIRVARTVLDVIGQEYERRWPKDDGG